MKMKKVMTFLLMATMTVASLAGCGGKSSNDSSSTVSEGTDKETESGQANDDMLKQPADGETVELQIAVFEGGYGRDYWDKVAEAFEATHEGVKVVIQANPEIGEVIRPNILAGNPPDFIYLSSGEKSGVTRAMIKDKAIADISDVAAELQDKMLPGFAEASVCQPYGDGKTYLLPMYYSAMGLWYNKAFFEENNLEVPVTWDDFFALGETAKEYDRALFTYQGTVPSYLESMLLPAVASASGEDVMQACLRFDSEAWQDANVKAVLQNIADIGLKGYLMEGTVALDHTQAQSQWLLGKAMFHPNGSWVEGEMADAPREEGFEFGFTAPPILSADNEKYVYTTVEEMFIPKDAKNIELAKEFLAFQYSDEAIALNVEYAKGIPPVKGAAELLKDVVSPAIYESYTVFENGYKPFVGRFASLADTEIIPNDELYNPVGDVMSGNMSVDEWVQKMVDVSNEVRDKIVQ